MKRIIKTFLISIICALIFGLGFCFRSRLYNFFDPFLSRLNFVIDSGLKSLAPPCQKPINYSLGEIDKRFNLSEEELLNALKEAGDIWSESINRQLFSYVIDGELKINLIYDYRQSAIDKLKELGIIVGDSQESYEKLKSEYESLSRRYKEQKTILDNLTAGFKQKQNVYEAEVEKWNSRGGALQPEFDRLNRIKSDLEAEMKQINDRAVQLNNLVDSLNAEAAGLNKMIAEFNLNVAKYNNVGETVPREFEEGTYIQNAGGQMINIYEFDGRERLVRLLAHEFGHALNLEHTNDPGDIMYYLNQGDNQKLTANDLSALQAACALK